MNSANLLKTVLTKVALGCLLCGPALANTIIMPTGVDWSRGEGLWIREDGVDTNAYFGGVIFLSISDGVQQWSRDSLCVDLFTDIYLGQQYGTTILTPSEVPGQESAAGIVARRQRVIAYPGFRDQQRPARVISGLPPRHRAPAFRLAIWDIVHDGGDGFSSGRVQAVTDPAHPTDASVLAWANLYESDEPGPEFQPGVHLPERESG